MSLSANLTLKELKNIPLESFFQSILHEPSGRVVRLPDGNEILIQAKPKLKPLVVLEGHLPVGWKDAIYESE